MNSKLKSNSQLSGPSTKSGAMTVAASKSVETDPKYKFEISKDVSIR